MMHGNLWGGGGGGGGDGGKEGKKGERKDSGGRGEGGGGIGIWTQHLSFHCSCVHVLFYQSSNSLPFMI